MALVALGRYGVLRVPDQHLDSRAPKTFFERFGDIQASSRGSSGHDPDVPEVGFLSDIKENGRYIGAPDAGQDWHTDMSCRDVTHPITGRTALQANPGYTTKILDPAFVRGALGAVGEQVYAAH